VAGHADDDVGCRCASNGHFVAVLVLPIVFALADAIGGRFVQRVDFVFVLLLLTQHPFVKQEVFLVTVKQPVLGQVLA
jgi:hypothetical protein